MAVRSVRHAPGLEALESRQLLSTIAEYPLSSAAALPVAIASGPGGQMWFIEQGANRIASIDPVTHAIQSTAIPTSAAYASNLTARARRQGLVHRGAGRPDRSPRPGDRFHQGDPDADAPTPIHSGSRPGRTATSGSPSWGASQIGMINPATDAITEYPTPTSHSEPSSIAVGPDGNLWFTEFTGDQIGMINPKTGAMTEFALPTKSAQPQAITAGPDGNIWFTEFGADQIGTINLTTHAITEIPTPSVVSRPSGIAAGPDGHIWFTEEGSGKIGVIDPTSHAITESFTPTYGSSPDRDRGGSGRQHLVHRVGRREHRRGGDRASAGGRPTASHPSSGGGGGPSGGAAGPLPSHRRNARSRSPAALTCRSHRSSPRNRS